jgi:hypothetical protein
MCVPALQPPEGDRFLSYKPAGQQKITMQTEASSPVVKSAVRPSSFRLNVPT